LQDVEEYRKNEDDYIAKITALQKYVASYKASQKKVDELTATVASLEEEKEAHVARIRELETKLEIQEESAKELHKSHKEEIDKINAEHNELVEDHKGQFVLALEALREEHKTELENVQNTLAEASTVQTAEQYLDKISGTVRGSIDEHELFMKVMRANSSYEGIPWPMDIANKWDALPVPKLTKRAHDSGYPAVLSMVNLAAKSLWPELDAECEKPDTPLNPVKKLLSCLMESEMHTAYYYVTLQKLASAEDGGSAAAGRSEGSSQRGTNSLGGSAPSTSRSATSASPGGKGMALWA
jgi:hypothetical protein